MRPFFKRWKRKYKKVPLEGTPTIDFREPSFFGQMRGVARFVERKIVKPRWKPEPKKLEDAKFFYDKYKAHLTPEDLGLLIKFVVGLKKGVSVNYEVMKEGDIQVGRELKNEEHVHHNEQEHDVPCEIWWIGR